MDPSLLKVWSLEAKKIIFAQEILLDKLFDRISTDLWASPSAFHGYVLESCIDGMGKRHIITSLAHSLDSARNDTHSITVHLIRKHDLLLGIGEEDIFSTIARIFRHGAMSQVSAFFMPDTFLDRICSTTTSEQDKKKEEEKGTEADFQASLDVMEDQLYKLPSFHADLGEALLGAFYALSRRQERKVLLFARTRDSRRFLHQRTREHFQAVFSVQLSTWQQRQVLLERAFNVEPELAVFLSQRTAGCSVRDLEHIARAQDPASALTNLIPSVMRIANTRIPFHKIEDLVALDHVIAPCRQILNAMLSLTSNSFKMTRGILLHGPSGTGKTHLAMALARESGLNYHYLEASSLMSKYVGEAEKKVASLFAMARSAAPCIILIDHLEALLPSRDGGIEGFTGGHGLSRPMIRLMTTFLTELDGLLSDISEHPVLILAMSTNINALDPAILRPGRLDYHFAMPHGLSKTSVLEYFRKRCPASIVGWNEQDLVNVLDDLSLSSSESIITGAQLDMIWRRAVMGRLRKMKSIINDPSTNPSPPLITIDDLAQVLFSIRPL